MRCLQPADDITCFDFPFSAHFACLSSETFQYACQGTRAHSVHSPLRKRTPAGEGPVHRAHGGVRAAAPRRWACKASEGQTPRPAKLPAGLRVSKSTGPGRASHAPPLTANTGKNQTVRERTCGSAQTSAWASHAIPGTGAGALAGASAQLSGGCGSAGVTRGSRDSQGQAQAGAFAQTRAPALEPGGRRADQPAAGPSPSGGRKAARQGTEGCHALPLLSQAVPSPHVHDRHQTGTLPPRGPASAGPGAGARRLGRRGGAPSERPPLTRLRPGQQVWPQHGVLSGTRKSPLGHTKAESSPETATPFRN